MAAMTSQFTVRSAPVPGPRRHRGAFQSETLVDVEAASRTWAQSRTTFRRDAYRVVMRKRTLDEYPMAHSRADTVRMLQQRRADKEAQRRSLECTLGESKNLSSYSRRRFETALHSKRGEAQLPPPTSLLPDGGDRPLFFREVLPPWQKKRHSMSLSPCSELVRLAPRPDSEPPLCPRSSQGRTFNHLRRTSAAYPRIRQLLQNYNNEFRVVCTAPPAVCRQQQQRHSAEVSVGSEFLLVPLQEDQPEDRSEDQLISTLSLLERKADGEGEEAEEKSSSAKGSDVEILEPGQIRTKLTKPEAALQPREQEEAPLAVTEPVEYDESPPSPPWRCWVDDATVSSISKHSEPEALPEDNAPASPVPETPGQPDGNAGSEATLKMNKLEAKAATSSTEKPPSPMGVADTPSGKKKSLTKGKRKKEPEPPVEVEPPVVVVVEEVQPEVEEVVEEVEEEVEPVLPSYICPSSEVKSHQTETKLWLRKSTFSAANRSVPIF